jgi:hypothetical protein
LSCSGSKLIVWESKSSNLGTSVKISKLAVRKLLSELDDLVSGSDSISRKLELSISCSEDVIQSLEVLKLEFS